MRLNTGDTVVLEIMRVCKAWWKWRSFGKVLSFLYAFHLGRGGTRKENKKISMLYSK